MDLSLKRVHLRGAARHHRADREEGGRGEAADSGRRADQGEDEPAQEEGSHAQEQGRLHREDKCGHARFTQPIGALRVRK